MEDILKTTKILLQVLNTVNIYVKGVEYSQKSKGGHTDRQEATLTRTFYPAYSFGKEPKASTFTILKILS